MKPFNQIKETTIIDMIYSLKNILRVLQPMVHSKVQSNFVLPLVAAIKALNLFEYNATSLALTSLDSFTLSSLNYISRILRFNKRFLCTAIFRSIQIGLIGIQF